MGREDLRRRPHLRSVQVRGCGANRQPRLCAVPARHESRARSTGPHPCPDRQHDQDGERGMAGAPQPAAVEEQHDHRRGLPRAVSRRAGEDRLRDQRHRQARPVRDRRRAQAGDRHLQPAARRYPGESRRTRCHLRRGVAQGDQQYPRRQAERRGSRCPASGVARPGGRARVRRQGAGRCRARACWRQRPRCPATTDGAPR